MEQSLPRPDVLDEPRVEVAFIKAAVNRIARQAYRFGQLQRRDHAPRS